MVEIAISVAAKIAEYLVAPVARPFSYLWNYKTNLENLKNGVKKLEAKREAVQHSVEDARRNCEEIEKHVESWLEDVTKIIDEASEVGEDNHQQASMQCFKGFSCTNLMKRYQHSKKAAKLKAVVGVQEEAGKFEKVSYRTIPEQACLQPSKGYQTFESRMSILKDLIDALSDSDVNMVGIYGMGGVGKTTLAKEVAREAYQKNGLSLFDKIIFVEVSESPDIKNIQGVVAENLGLQFTEETVSGRANRLCDRLKKEEKILLILDNIWGRIDFVEIGIPIENNRRGLKLLLTTRNRNVLTNQMDCRHNFEVDALNKADAWSLFTSITGTFIEHPNLNSIACEVAEECGGMPVAIVTLAEALKGQGQNEWRDALRELKNSSLKIFGGIAQGVYTSIRLSYDYLENDKLRETFLLCSCMGCTYDASVQDLFRYGLGLGLFENFNTLDEALCNVYVSVNKLKATSLLLDAPKSETIFDPPANERFAMHDIICDVAKSIANVFTVIDAAIPQSWTNENTLINCTSITLHNIDELPEDLELVCPQLKLLYVKSKDSSFRIPDNFFTRMLGLQVLHLIGINLQLLPTSISCLLDLQTLCLDRCELGDMAVIGNLKKLKILSFCGSNIEKLSDEIRHLTRLRLLDLTNCSNLSVITPNVMSNLKKLEALYMGNTSIQWEVERSNIERSNVSIDELKYLPYLTMLEIHIPDAKMSKGLLSQKLEKYKIFIGDKWSWHHWSSRSKTSRMLKLSLNSNEDENIFQYLKGIEELELGEVPGATNLVDALDRNGFPRLKHLDVVSNSHCSCIFESSDALPLLESLLVYQMKVLENICNRPLGENSFLQLRTIRVKNSHKLNNIFSSSAVTIFPQLQEIEVSHCQNMEEIFAIGGQDDANNTEVVHEIELNQLRILTLKNLSRLKSFCCKVKTDSPLQLTSDTQPREIISEEEKDICTLLFNEKVACPNLQTLCISKIAVEKIWHSLPPKISSCVQNLTKLRVYGCGNLKELFSSSTVITEESRAEETRDKIVFPKLNSIWITNLEKLTTLCSGYYIEFPTLEEFKIGSCPQLDAFIFDDKVRVPSLEIINIRFMDNLKMIWHNQLDGDSFRKLKSLQVYKCQKLLTLFPSNICGRLLSLQELSVDRCQSLKYLFAASNTVANDEYSPKFLFPKLTSLVLYNLPELRSFYPGRHTVEGPVLKRLKLSDCFIHDTDEEGQTQMQQPLFFVEQAFPCLEELGLHGKNIMMMRQGQVPESLFVKLKILEVWSDDDSTNLPLCIIQRFQNLEKLSLRFSSYKEIFSNGEDQTQAPTPARTKTLDLRYLKDLKYMWKHDFKLDLTLQNLEVLDIRGCKSLINVMPPSASFQNLTVMEVESCDNLINIGTSSAAKSLVQLTQMRIKECRTIIEVVGNHGDVTEDEIIFPKLKSLSLEDLPSLTSFCSWNVTLQFPSLEELTVNRCPNMNIFSQGVISTQILKKLQITEAEDEGFWEGDLNTTVHKMFKEMVGFRGIENLTLSKFPYLQVVWHNQFPVSIFGNLKSLVVDNDCSSLRYIPSVALDLVQLQELKITNCGILETIIGTEEERTDDTLFPNLNRLELKDLPKLSRFRIFAGNSIKLPSLTQLWIDNCPNMETFIFDSIDADMPASKENFHRDIQPFFDEKVRFPSLEKMVISGMDNLESIWHNQFVGDSFSFSKLKSVEVNDCQELKTIFPSCICGGLSSLESLTVKSCSLVEEIFNLQWPNLKEKDSIEATTQLRELYVDHMSNLKRIWNKDPKGMLSYGKLQKVTVFLCPNLENLFPASVAKSLLNLVSLEVSDCGLLKEIIAKGGEKEAADRLLFPKLSTLQLHNLPQLRTFYTGKTVEVSCLKRLGLHHCDNVKLFISEFLGFYETIELEGTNQGLPILEELQLSGKEITMEWLDQVLGHVFRSLKSLELNDLESTVLPLHFIQKFGILGKLSLNSSSYMEIFSSYGEVKEHPQIKHLVLGGLFDLKEIWKQGLKIDPKFQNLQILEARSCFNLINLMPSSASFQNLKSLEVWSCDGLKNLLTSSTAKSLVLLEKLEVFDCKMLIEVVANEGVVTEEINFRKLKSLSLMYLQSLAGFCSTKHILNFPILESLVVNECPKMKIFSEGVTSTPKLHKLELNWEACEQSWEVGVNTTIKQNMEKR